MPLDARAVDEGREFDGAEHVGREGVWDVEDRAVGEGEGVGGVEGENFAGVVGGVGSWARGERGGWRLVSVLRGRVRG